MSRGLWLGWQETSKMCCSWIINFFRHLFYSDGQSMPPPKGRNTEVNSLILFLTVIHVLIKCSVLVFSIWYNMISSLLCYSERSYTLYPTGFFISKFAVAIFYDYCIWLNLEFQLWMSAWTNLYLNFFCSCQKNLTLWTLLQYLIDMATNARVLKSIIL